MPDLSLVANVLTLSEALSLQARAHPDRLAFADDDGTLTFGELDTETGRLAASLSGLGVQPRDHVGLVISSGIPFARAFWALQRIGAVPFAMNPHAPPATLARRAASIRPRLVLYDPRVAPGLGEHAGPLRCVTLEEAGTSSAKSWSDAIGTDDLAWLQPTSGTSGEPRIAMILHRNVLALLRSMFAVFQEEPTDVYVSWVPPWHDLGLVRFVIGTVYAGRPTHIVPPAIHTIPRWLETIERVRGTITGAPDFAWRIAARIGNPDLDLSSLRYAVNGGEPVRMSTIRMFEERFRLDGALRPGYGLAEATLGVSFTRIGERVVTDERGNVANGTPPPGLEVRIDAPSGEPGEILVRGPSVFAGYLDAPEATAEKLRDGWLYTGDIGRLDGEGRLYILGRKRAMLKRGGAILAPRELEEAAQRVPGVKVAAAVGLSPSEDQTTEQIVVAVEPEGRDSPRELIVAVLDAIREVVGFVPDRVLVLESKSIARTWNGKIRHAALAESIASGELAARGAIITDGTAGD